METGDHKDLPAKRLNFCKQGIEKASPFLYALGNSRDTQWGNISLTTPPSRACWISIDPNDDISGEKENFHFSPTRNPFMDFNGASKNNFSLLLDQNFPNSHDLINPLNDYKEN